MMNYDELKNILLCAIAGDQDALEEIFDMYAPLICKYCYVRGVFDEDLKQHLYISIALNITKFRI